MDEGPEHVKLNPTLASENETHKILTKLGHDVAFEVSFQKEEKKVWVTELIFELCLLEVAISLHRITYNIVKISQYQTCL
jgi:hypothetical protein